ncbi:MAG: response regulator, partial [Gemmatimonadetes bacterium]|nr:response regulator [Gemmatimonadota bacterium]
TIAHGLAGMETNRAAGLAEPDGRVWIGTAKGVSLYDPAADNAPLRGPTVQVLSLDANGRTVPADRPVRLGPHDNTLIFHFRAISFIGEEAVRFRVRLEGFDEDWLPEQELPQRSMRYTNLPPGDYRMTAQVIDANGSVSDIARSEAITVPTAPLNSPWVRALVLVAVIGAVFAVVSALVQARYARKLEVVVRERTEELMKTERELAKGQRLEALGVLAGGIAHDFNNILQVILGGASLLEANGELHGRDRSLVREVKAAGKRAQTLTEQLLTFSEGGHPVRQPSSIADFIEGAVNFALSGSNVRGVVELDDDLWVVDIDPGQITRVLDNLLINARQAMPDGGRVFVRAENVMHPPAPVGSTGRHVLVEVEDEGEGIPEANLGRIFDPFFSTKSSGTGLGLAVAHSVVEKHGGRLLVKSVPGQGTTFRIFLPASDVAVVQDADSPQSAAERGGRVLVMDDDNSVRTALLNMLAGLGYETTGTDDGERAIELYRDAMERGAPFDVVIMDLTVPGGCGGREAIRRLRVLDPDVRAIVVSGYSNDPVLARYREEGFRGFLGKPFAMDRLAETMESVLREPASGGR